MTGEEFSREFDIRFNYINSNLGYSVNAYEKSVYLTRAQEQLLSNYFNSKGNKYGEGFDMSEKRHVDFSSIIKHSDITSNYNSIVPISDNGIVFEISDDVMFVLNETFNYKKSDNSDIKTSVFPIEYKDFQRVLSKPYQSPPKRQSWRIIAGGTASGHLFVEIIPKSNIDKSKAYKYCVRYIKRPTPIIVANLTGDLSGLTVNGLSTKTECVLPAEIHDEILDRAMEMARADYLGDANLQIQLNQRNE